MALDFACKQFELEEVIKCGLALTKSDFKLMKFLIKNPQKFSSQKLASVLKLDVSTLQRSLKRLYEKKIVIRSQINLSNGGYIYNYEIREKVFIRKILKDIVKAWSKKVEDELDRW